MKRTLLAALSLAALAGLTGACGFQHSTSVTAPTTPGAATGTGTPSTKVAPSLVGTWVSNEVAIPSPKSCGHFQYQIASQTSSSISGTFTAQCGSGSSAMDVQASASGQLNGNSVAITLNGTGSMTGIPSCTFSLSGTGTIEDNGNTLRIPYSGTTCLGPVNGTEVLHKPAPSSPAPPEPAPTPTPPAPTPTPTPPSIPGGFNLGAVTVVGGSPSDAIYWPATSEITSIVFSPGTFHIDHTKRGQWPGVDIGGALQESTIWIFENINGRWYATGGERLRPGQTDKGLGNPSEIANGWFYSSFWAPLSGYVPRVGEVVGFMVTAGSTRADNNAPVHERTGVVLIPFPPDWATTSYPPFLWKE